jgi:hypothetical protein
MTQSSLKIIIIIIIIIMGRKYCKIWKLGPGNKNIWKLENVSVSPLVISVELWSPKPS